MRRWQLVIFVAVLALAAGALPRLTQRTDAFDQGDVVGGGWTADMSLSPIDVLFVGNSTLAWAMMTQ